MKSLELIGNTPLFNIPNTNIYAKLEKYNLTGSIKDRTILGMVTKAKEKNLINENTIIVEATSGNTGISIAALAGILGFRAVIVMSESMSKERREIIKAYGAQLVLTPKELGTKGAIAKAKEIIENNKDAIGLDQFENLANADYHYETTAREIFEQLPDLDIFVAGVGTGGTFTGVSRYLKEQNKNIITVALEPEDSPAISQGKSGVHRIQGIGTGFIPGNFDRGVMDEVLTITNEEAIEEAKNFLLATGIGVGISSGAAIAGAKKLEKKYPNKKIVTILADGIEKYLSVLKFPEINHVEI